MEITKLSPSYIKIRGKRTTISINPTDKSGTQNAVILHGNPQQSSIKIEPGVVVINGPGEYEISGVKITGIKSGEDVVYSLSVDSVNILLGKLLPLERVHTKLKEHNALLVQADDVTDPSFLTALSPNAVLFFGDQAAPAVKSFGNEAAQQTSKYTISLEKLPQEMETIVLQ